MTFHNGDLYLVDSITHTIIKKKKYFEYLTLTKTNITIISSSTHMINGPKKANILLSNNIKLGIKDALYSPESKRNLLYICAKGYHIETIDEDKKEYLYLISCISGQKLVLEKLHDFSFGNYYTITKSIKTNVVIH